MPRPTIAHLISRVRILIGAPGTTQFTDDEIQTELDATAVRVHEERLDQHIEQTLPRWFTYPHGSWEDTIVLRDSNGTVVASDTEDLVNGEWWITAGHPGPLYITGVRYDVYAASASLLRAWAAALKTEYDFSAEGRTFQRSQKIGHLLDLAATYEARAISPGAGGAVGSVAVPRSDWS